MKIYLFPAFLLLYTNLSAQEIKFSDVKVKVPVLDLKECAIRVGESGKTWTYSKKLALGQVAEWPSNKAASFIRSTSGPCHITIYNKENFKGRRVTLGSNLNGRIRAGLDGIRYKDSGGGETWRIRSIKIKRVDTTCRLRIGGNGIRMDYYVGNIPSVPAMDRISWFLGGDGSAKIWNDVSFGLNDKNNRFKALHPSGQRSGSYDPGFRVRSIKIHKESGKCPSYAKDRGRCLPQTILKRSIYSVRGKQDLDEDGLVDAFENQLATAFRPIYVNHSTENATRVNAYTTVTGKSVIEPVTIFQVHPVKPGEIVIRFMKLFLWDRQDTWTCPGHKGDSQAHEIYLLTTPLGGDSLYGRFWYLYKTTDGIENDLRWQKGDGSIRGVTFEKWPGERNVAGTANHEVIYFTKGKHHEYADGGWSGQTDKRCGYVKAHIDSRGQLHNPSLPKRIAIIRSPRGKGDRFDFNNVGRGKSTKDRKFRFFDDLTPFGFPGKRVWSGKIFYTTKAGPVNRRFE